MIKVSFLITYYNQEDFVKDSLLSVINQNGEFYKEILIGDNNSTDNTIKIVNEIIENEKHRENLNIKLFKNIRDEKELPFINASKNRLELLKNATGDFVIFLDGDDFYCDYNFVQNAIDFLNKDSNKKYVGVCHDYELFYSSNRKEFDCIDLKAGEVNSELFVKDNYRHLGTIILRNFFTQDLINTYRKTYIFDDIFVAYIALLHGKLFFINKIVLDYRQLEHSITNNYIKIEFYMSDTLIYYTSLKYLEEYKKPLFFKFKKAMALILLNIKDIDNIKKEKLERYKFIARVNNAEFLNDIFNWKNISFLKKITLFTKFVVEYFKSKYLY